MNKHAIKNDREEALTLEILQAIEARSYERNR